MNTRKFITGFWISYIETLTSLAVIFLILFVAAANRERAINKRQEQLVKLWHAAREKLTELGTSPIIDPMMGGIRITLADSLIFPLNSYLLSDEGKKLIIKISKISVDLYKINPSYRNVMRIKVGGHTDRIGGDTIDFPLSYQRALNVTNII